MNKKGAELTLNTVIVAVLALLVMIILILIFTGKISIFGTELGDCSSRGGVCNLDEGECRDQGGKVSAYSCKGDGEKCCLDPCIAAGGKCTDTCEAGKELLFASCAGFNEGKTCCK